MQKAGARRYKPTGWSHKRAAHGRLRERDADRVVRWHGSVSLLGRRGRRRSGRDGRTRGIGTSSSDRDNRSGRGAGKRSVAAGAGSPSPRTGCGVPKASVIPAEDEGSGRGQPVENLFGPATNAAWLYSLAWASVRE